MVPIAAPDDALGTGRRWALRVDRRFVRKLSVIRWLPPVLHPLRHVAVNVEQAERIALQLGRIVRATAGIGPTPSDPHPGPCPDSPHQYFVVVPARQANSHSASVGSR